MHAQSGATQQASCTAGSSPLCEGRHSAQGCGALRLQSSIAQPHGRVAPPRCGTPNKGWAFNKGQALQPTTLDKNVKMGDAAMPHVRPRPYGTDETTTFKRQHPQHVPRRYYNITAAGSWQRAGSRSKHKKQSAARHNQHTYYCNNKHRTLACSDSATKNTAMSACSTTKCCPQGLIGLHQHDALPVCVVKRHKMVLKGSTQD